VARSAGALLTALVVLLAVFFISFPGEALDNNVVASRSGVHAWLFGSSVNEAEERRLGVVSNTLVLADQDFVDGEKLDKVNRTLILRDRDFRGAVLTRADLRKADLTRADLEDADLFQANLRQADLSKADLRRANLNQARLDEAVLFDARLQEAKLEWANLEGALLSGATLDLAHLAHANLSGISAIDTKGTMFRGADLTGTNLKGGALEGTEFQGATLTDTNFQGASLDRADFSVAGFSSTKLDGASMTAVRLWRTYPNGVTACFTSATPLFARMGLASILDLERSSILENISHDLSEEGKVELAQKLSELFSTSSSWTKYSEAGQEKRWSDTINTDCRPDTLANRLIRIACADDHSYVLRGLIANGILKDLSLSNFNQVFPALTDSEKCPGAAELPERDKVTLRTLALVERP
jgi:uncharacterized protein YjbI with pentapeptide repeats